MSSSSSSSVFLFSMASFVLCLVFILQGIDARILSREDIEVPEQMGSRFYSKGSIEEASSTVLHSRSELKNSGSLQKRVPIQSSPKKADLFLDELHVIPNKTSSRNIHPLDDQNNIIIHRALYKTKDGEYYGTKASINVYGLHDVVAGQESTSQISLLNIDDGQYNSIEAGWHVRPQLYGDNHTRLYIYWTVDKDEKTGCFNLLCPGFVQKHPHIIPGSIVQPLSTYNGQQYHITLLLFKDKKTGDWLLNYGDDESSALIGYWPKSLFSGLSNSASEIGWGGLALFPPGLASPPMGSGHYASEGFGKAAFIRGVKIIDNDYTLKDPEVNSLVPRSDKGECYTLGEVNDFGGEFGCTFYYGGPGGCSD